MYVYIKKTNRRIHFSNQKWFKVEEHLTNLFSVTKPMASIFTSSWYHPSSSNVVFSMQRRLNSTVITGLLTGKNINHWTFMFYLFKSKVNYKF